MKKKRNNRIIIFGSLLLPKVVRVRHFDNANSTTESAAVHRAAKFPVVGFFVVNFNRLQVRSAVEPTHGVQLSIDNGQANLR